MRLGQSSTQLDASRKYLRAAAACFAAWLLGIGRICSALRAEFDTVGLICDIEHTSLNVVINLTCRANEGFLYILGGFGRCFNENKTVFIGEGLALFCAHRSSSSHTNVSVMMFPVNLEKHTAIHGSILGNRTFHPNRICCLPT